MIDGRIVIVHPDDVNLADVKAAAACHDATVVGNPYVPHGKLFVIDGRLVGGFLS